MSPQQRSAVWSAYQAFADEINGQTDRSNLPATIVDDQALFQIAHDRLDFFQAENLLFCYDWVSRRKFRLHKGWKKLFAILDAIAPFRREELSRYFPELVADWLFTQLESHDFLGGKHVSEEVEPVNSAREQFVSAHFRQAPVGACDL